MRLLAGGVLGGWVLLASTAGASWLPETVRIGRLGIAYDEWSVVLTRVGLERRPGAPLALSVDRIEGPAGIIPLWASLRIGPAATGWRMDGVMASAKGEFVLRFNGASDGGALDRIAIAMEPLRFEPGALQPVRLWSGFEDVLGDARGTIDLALDWQRGQPEAADLALTITGLAFVTDYGEVGPINGSIRLDRLWPPRTAMPQKLRVEGLDFGRLVDGLEIDELTVEGIMDADLVFSFNELGRMHIEQGHLEARGPGIIRYRPQSPPPLLESQGANVDLLIAALANFRYDAAVAMLEGFLDGDIAVALHLHGANPELYEDQPIELNLSLEAPILGLVSAGRNAFELPIRLRRALQELAR